VNLLCIIKVGMFIILFALKESRNVFHTLESLYVYFSQPARNKNLIDIQKNLGIKIVKLYKNVMLLS
jgi:hypothetical protein